MVRFGEEDFAPRLSAEGHRRSAAFPFSPLRIKDGLSRKTVSYSKLSQEPLKLSVLKLDASCFDIEVTKAATVADLKQAVEAVFSYMPKNGPGKISWPHLWGHFCLSYDGQKLVTDTDHIIDYGIKDGDQLHFIRHISIIYNLVKKRSKKWIIASDHHKMVVSRSNSIEEIEENDNEDNDCGELENRKLRSYADKHENLVEHHQSRFAHFFTGWFLYSTLVTEGRTSCEGNNRPSRFAGGFFGSFRKILKFCCCKRHSRRCTWRED